MNVLVQAGAGRSLVSVLGRDVTPDAQQQLLELLLAQPAGDGGMELRLYDAVELPQALIEALCERLDRGVPLKLTVYHALLAQELLRLGLPARLVLREDRAREPLPQCRALLLAASANRLEALLTMAEALPPSAAVVVAAVPLPPDAVDQLAPLLALRCSYTVKMPEPLCRIEPGTLYLLPPGQQMTLSDGLIQLKAAAPSETLMPLFESLAQSYRDGLLAVCLGAPTVERMAACDGVQRAQGRVLSERMDAALASGSPTAAMACGPEPGLPLPALLSLVPAAVQGQTGVPDGALLERFLEAVHALSGQDFRPYQRPSLRRRIAHWMTRLQLKRFADLQLALFAEPPLLERFVADLPVGVTCFFRHPEQLRELREQVLPFLQSFPVLKLWCAGCASGEEAYSLAILLEEAGLAERSHIFATDLNVEELKAARSGLYAGSVWDEALRGYAASGGQQDLRRSLCLRGRLLRVSPSLRRHLLFFRHSLTDEGIFNEFQFIICRNVLIYFDTELQRRVLRHFAQSLHPEGRLVLGPQDGMTLMAREQGFMPVAPGSHVYILRA